MIIKSEQKTQKHQIKLYIFSIMESKGTLQNVLFFNFSTFSTSLKT